MDMDMDMDESVCSKCGNSMVKANATNMCWRCLGSEIDLRGEYPSSVSLTRCGRCKYYVQPPNRWIELPDRVYSKEKRDHCWKMMTMAMGRPSLLKQVFQVGLDAVAAEMVELSLGVKRKVYGVEAFTYHTITIKYPIQWTLCKSCHSGEDEGLAHRVAALDI